MLKRRKSSALQWFIIIALASAVGLFAILHLFSDNYVKWYELPLDYNNRKQVNFVVDGRPCSIILVGVKGQHDLSNMWGGCPVSDAPYVAVAIDCEGFCSPLLGKSGSFLDLNMAEYRGGKLFLRGSDGGLSWSAEGQITFGKDHLPKLKIYSVSDERMCFGFHLN